MANIDLQGMMADMATGMWFSISYVTYDKKKGKAGEIIRIARARLHTGTGSDAAVGDSVQRRHVAQNHQKHFTRNLRLMNGEIRKVHLRLVFEYNGKNLI